MPSGRNWRSQQLGFSQNALQGKLCSSSSSSSKQCRCFFLSDWRGYFCFVSPVCIHQMGARSSVENLGEGGIAGEEIPGSLPPSSNSSFFAMKLEDNADSALYPRRRKKLQTQSFWLQRCWKWVSTCSGSQLSKSGFVVRSFLCYIALVSHWFQQSVSLFNALFLASCLVSFSCQKRTIRMFFLSDSQSCLSLHAVFLHIMDAVVG